MRYVSLFSGIGGFDLGFDRAGMTCVAQVEKDKFCRAVLAKHWPNVPKFDDVTTFRRNSFHGPVDLIAGGFPCQPHSKAGKRKASADERDLWPEFARIIREFKPKWIVAENVPGLLSSEDGRFFGGVLRDLAQSGYDAEWDCIPAAIFGAPHIRYRVFVVAYTSESGRHGILQSNLPSGDQAHYHPAWSASNPLDAGCHIVQRIESWLGEPAIFGSDDGFPQGMDRTMLVNQLNAFGNAVAVPVAEWLGNRIMEAQNA